MATIVLVAELLAFYAFELIGHFLAGISIGIPQMVPFRGGSMDYIYSLPIHCKCIVAFCRTNGDLASVRLNIASSSSGTVTVALLPPSCTWPVL